MGGHFDAFFELYSHIEYPTQPLFLHFSATTSTLTRMLEEVPKAPFGAKNAENGSCLAHIYADCAGLARNSGVCLPGALF